MREDYYEFIVLQSRGRYDLQIIIKCFYKIYDRVRISDISCVESNPGGLPMAPTLTRVMLLCGVMLDLII